MFTVAVANIKGGCGKTTLATHLAARWARMGFKTLLADLDRQRSGLDWVARRPASLPRIEAVALDRDAVEIPVVAPYVVVDVPAGLRRRELEQVIRVADIAVVPVLPSIFDEGGTERFVAMVQEFKPVRKGRRTVAVVGNRWRPRSRAGTRLDSFLDGLSFPAVARLSDSQVYVDAAMGGLTLFDRPPARVRRLLDEWAPLLRMLDERVNEIAQE